jgi:hypothetical protein
VVKPRAADSGKHRGRPQYLSNRTSLAPVENLAYGPKADITIHSITSSALAQRRRHGEAERLGSLEVED